MSRVLLPKRVYCGHRSGTPESGGLPARTLARCSDCHKVVEVFRDPVGEGWFTAPWWSAWRFRRHEKAVGAPGEWRDE